MKFNSRKLKKLLEKTKSLLLLVLVPEISCFRITNFWEKYPLKFPFVKVLKMTFKVKLDSIGKGVRGRIYLFFSFSGLFFYY